MIPAQVHAGYVDLSFHAVVGNEKWAGLKVIPFKQDPLVAICCCKQQLARQRSITLELLAGEKFVDLTPERGLRKLVDRVFIDHNLKRDSLYQVSDVYMMLQFVAAGLGVAIIPSELTCYWAHPEQLHALRITTSGAPLPKWRIVIVTLAQRRSPPGKTRVDRFLETLADMKVA